MTAESIAVTVKYLSALRDQAGVGCEVLHLPRGATLRDVSARVAEAHGIGVPSAQTMATLNGRGWAQYSQGLDTPAGDGDVIDVFPPIAGG